MTTSSLFQSASNFDPIMDKYADSNTITLHRGDASTFLKTIPDGAISLIITSPPYNNRIMWHFEHGLHASRRFSGRYETLLWFSKSDVYTFNLDPVRVPAKYPGKLHFKGPNRGQPSGNPLGKNPSDVWKFLCEEWESGYWDIPNVKANHIEKTNHPCQFPVELVERCVLALTGESDL